MAKRRLKSVVSPFSQPYGSREIYKDGELFFIIDRKGAKPVEADAVGRLIGQMLSQMTQEEWDEWLDEYKMT